MGGKEVWEGRKESMRTLGSLGRWLQSGSVGAGGPGAEAGEVKREEEESVASGMGGK